MSDPREFWFTEEQVQAAYAARTAKDGKKKPHPEKESKAGFLKLSIPLWRKLVDDKAGRNVWAMVGALYEAWFTTGLHLQHPNPFPLARVDVKRWGLDRRQKHFALKFLAQIRLVDIDRSNPENPMVTLAWAPLYHPEASR